MWPLSRHGTYPFPLLPQTRDPLTHPPPFLQTWNLGTYPSPYSPRHGTWVFPLCYWHSVVITGDLFKPVHLRTYLPFPSPVLTFSGDHRNACKWQARSTHATRMLSCLEHFLYYLLHYTGVCITVNFNLNSEKVDILACLIASWGKYWLLKYLQDTSLQLSNAIEIN